MTSLREQWPELFHVFLFGVLISSRPASCLALASGDHASSPDCITAVKETACTQFPLLFKRPALCGIPHTPAHQGSQRPSWFHTLSAFLHILPHNLTRRLSPVAIKQYKWAAPAPTPPHPGSVHSEPRVWPLQEPGSHILHWGHPQAAHEDAQTGWDGGSLCDHG